MINRAKEPERPHFEQLIQDVMARYQAAGVAVAIVNQETTLYQNFFGWRDAENQLPIDENTIFGLASISKSFTALAILQLAERGAIDLEGPLSRYIPEFCNAHAAQPVKVWHLLCHSAGFLPQPRTLASTVAKEMGIWQEGQAELGDHPGLAQRGAELICRRLDSQAEKTGRPGENLSYSNDSFGLLSEIVRRYGGEHSFPDYIENHILAPLGMNRSGVRFIAPAQDPNCSKLYYLEEDQRQWTRDFYDNAFVLMGGGAMKSTLADMKRYLQMYLRGGLTQDGAAVIGDYSLREMTKPRQQYAFQQQYGYALSIGRMGDWTMIGHGGSLTGVSSNFQWCPELGVGVVVLCNTSGVPAALIAEEALRWFDGRQIPAPRRQWQDAGWTPEQIAQAIGTYSSSEGDSDNSVQLYEQDGKIALKRAGKPQPCMAAAQDLLIVPGPFSDGSIQLLRDPQRGVWGLRTGGRILTKE